VLRRFDAYWAQLRVDVATVLRHHRAAPGGWRDAWRGLARLTRERRLLVHWPAEAPGHAQVVLRTRISLNGDAITDVARSWLTGAKPEEVARIAGLHFENVRGAVRGWSAATALVRLAQSASLAVASLIFALDLRSLLREGWSAIWRHAPGLLAPLMLASFGLALRLGFRVWFRWRFRRGLVQTTRADVTDASG
jgi:hypothetical protein